MVLNRLEPYHPLNPIQRLTAAHGPSRQQRLEKSLIGLSSLYAGKNKTIPQGSDPYVSLDRQLENIAAGNMFDHFKVDQPFITTVMDTARRVSGNNNPIIIDMGGGSSTTHQRFAQAGAISVCIDPAAELLERVAASLNMIKVGSGVYKDRRLDHYRRHCQP